SSICLGLCQYMHRSPAATTTSAPPRDARSSRQRSSACALPWMSERTAMRMVVSAASRGAASSAFEREGQRERAEAGFAELPQIDRFDRDLRRAHDRDRFAEAQ